MIFKLKKLLNNYNLDAYIIPKNDDFFGEYAFPDRLKAISKFSGSAGFSIITKFQNYLFIDGRYLIQGKLESGKNFKIFEVPYTYPKDVLKNKIINKIGYDPKLFTFSTLERYFGSNYKLIPINNNLIDSIFLERKKKSDFFFKIDDKIVGETVISKVKRLNKILRKNRSDSIFISAPENVAWLLNIRGRDNPNSPIPNARILIDVKKNIYFFSETKKVSLIKKKINYKKIKFYSFGNFYNVLSKLDSSNFTIDKLSCSIFFLFNPIQKFCKCNSVFYVS